MHKVFGQFSKKISFSHKIFKKMSHSANLKISSPIIAVVNETAAKNSDDPESEEQSQAKKLKLNNDENNLENNAHENNETTEEKIRKHKYALLFGYLGDGYFGLQRF